MKSNYGLYFEFVKFIKEKQKQADFSYNHSAKFHKSKLKKN